MTRRILASFLLATFLAGSVVGCANDSGYGSAGGGIGMNKQTAGGLAGAGLGGLAGAQFGKGSGRLWTTGAGVLLGALAGSSVGQSLDKADQVYAERAYNTATTAPVGQQIAWNNPDSGNSGTVTTTRTGVKNGLPCREFQQTIVVGGKSQQAVGTACQNGDGTWQIQQ
jgi:surface antigen